MDQDLLLKKLKEQIEDFKAGDDLKEVGYIKAVMDGVVSISGLDNVMSYETLVFDVGEGKTLEDILKEDKPILGLTLNLEEQEVKAFVLGSAEKLKSGMKVYRTHKTLSIPVGPEIIGRVVSPLGEPLDSLGSYKSECEMPLEAESYGVIDRSAVNTPMHTGIKVIDALIPIGRGQRELIIGDRNTGKTTVAIDTILAQKYEEEENRPICIYVAIGQRESRVAKIVNDLRDAGAMKYTIVVTASASEAATLQFLAPFSGVSIGEYFMKQGKDVLIVYDDLSKQAVAYRQASLLLRRPPGREAYPGDVFYLHSRLLERAAKLSKENGGGSITALPIIETQDNDVSGYIPTNVISITDGQIYLDGSLFHKGIRPAVDIGLSVTRVGSAAQTKAMKSVAGKTKLQLSQFKELEVFAQFSQDIEEGTKRQLASGARIVQSLIQPASSPIHFCKQVVIIFAVTNGLFNSVPENKVQEATNALTDHLEAAHPDIFETITTEKVLTDKAKEDLMKYIPEFIEKNYGA